MGGRAFEGEVGLGTAAEGGHVAERGAWPNKKLSCGRWAHSRRKVRWRLGVRTLNTRRDIASLHRVTYSS